jgi:predicted dehydrogenase
MLGLSSHDISAMRELLGMPQRVLYAAQRQGGLYLSAAFDYGEYVCQFETGIDNIPRFDAHLEVYGENRTLRVQYDTPYVRNLPIRLYVTAANGQGGVVERAEHPAWGDAFVAEWRAFYTNVVERRTPKTPPSDFRQDLELFRDMIALMHG